ncbi:MAG: isochorismatase family protein [Candidatus Ancillula sp.]|nr:isochorismatase family protein [Candidatus Ancillula sp.]
MSKKNKILLIVDLQNDYLEGGSLSIDGATALSRRIAYYIKQHHGKFNQIILAQEWHIDPKEHFQQWVQHCVAKTTGAEIAPAVQSLIQKYKLRLLKKGQYDHDYSAFLGHFDDDKTLEEVIIDNKITDLTIIGIGLDYDMYATTVDALEKFPALKINILKPLVLSLAAKNEKGALKKYKSMGVNILDSKNPNYARFLKNVPKLSAPIKTNAKASAKSRESKKEVNNSLQGNNLGNNLSKKQERRGLGTLGSGAGTANGHSNQPASHRNQQGINHQGRVSYNQGIQKPAEKTRIMNPVPNSSSRHSSSAGDPPKSIPPKIIPKR